MLCFPFQRSCCCWAHVKQPTWSRFTSASRSRASSQTCRYSLSLHGASLGWGGRSCEERLLRVTVSCRCVITAREIAWQLLSYRNCYVSIIWPVCRVLAIKMYDLWGAGCVTNAVFSLEFSLHSQIRQSCCRQMYPEYLCETNASTSFFSRHQPSTVFSSTAIVQESLAYSTLFKTVILCLLLLYRTNSYSSSFWGVSLIPGMWENRTIYKWQLENMG